ncbi:glycine dehydrogenase (decarboxylating), mitochondrial-like, partial [Vigna umbellata]|uniref:glycine dehydrogenase (decarboxylating), mitochondrial-like n=1 Tax=Vigna umbellata TaxID=87088 RepID=UPI001F5FF07D
ITVGIEPEDVCKTPQWDMVFITKTMSGPVTGNTHDWSLQRLKARDYSPWKNSTFENHFFEELLHPPSLAMADAWTKPYSREYAAFPAPWLRAFKVLASYPQTRLRCICLDIRWTDFVELGRVDNVYGDRNLICTLLPASQAVEEEAAATA